MAYLVLLALYHFRVTSFFAAVQRLDLNSLENHIVLFPFAAVSAGYAVAMLFWQLPSMISARKYDVTPKSLGVAFVTGGTTFLLVAAAIAVISPNFTSGREVRLPIRLVFLGLIALVQGLGILLFRSKMLGVIAIVYALIVEIVAMCAIHLR